MGVCGYSLLSSVAHGFIKNTSVYSHFLPLPKAVFSIASGNFDYATYI